MIEKSIDSKFVESFIFKNRYLFPDNLKTVKNFKELSLKLIDKGEVFIYFDDKSIPCGMIAGYMNDKEIKSGYISLLFVEKAYEKKGVASSLINYFEKTSISEGMERIYVRAFKSNESAIKMYLKNNYEIQESDDSNKYLFTKKIFVE